MFYAIWEDSKVAFTYLFIFLVTAESSSSVVLSIFSRNLYVIRINNMYHKPLN